MTELMSDWGAIGLFTVFVVIMLALDLGVFHRGHRPVRVREALFWTGFWIALALLFNLGVYYVRGRQDGLEFLAGYLLEKALSIDNIFVFIMVFRYFRVPGEYQHKVLFWGILGALIMRAIFIFAGVALIHIFHPIIYVFGALLVYTGIKMATEHDNQIDPEHNPVLRWFKRHVPVTHEFHGSNFFILREGRRWATPLFVVLLFIEMTDVLFAVDSIPAVLAITTDPFIVYTSNIFAILGLRSLYFALAGVMLLFRYLNYGLSLILVFVGVKMLISGYYKIPIGVSLGAIAAILLISIAASLLRDRHLKKRDGQQT